MPVHGAHLAATGYPRAPGGRSGASDSGRFHSRQRNIFAESIRRGGREWRRRRSNALGGGADHGRDQCDVRPLPVSRSVGHVAELAVRAGLDLT